MFGFKYDEIRKAASDLKMYKDFTLKLVTLLGADGKNGFYNEKKGTFELSPEDLPSLHLFKALLQALDI